MDPLSNLSIKKSRTTGHDVAQYEVHNNTYEVLQL